MENKEIKKQEKIINNKLNCKLDGNCLCIESKNFIDLQESDAYFIKLDNEELLKIKQFFNNFQLNSFVIKLDFKYLNAQISFKVETFINKAVH